MSPDAQSGPARQPGALRLALTLMRLYLRGESRAVVTGLAVLLAASLAMLLEPWPLKIIIDSVLGTRAVPPFLDRLAGAAGSLLGLDSPRLALLSILCLAIPALRLALGMLRMAADYLLIGIGLRMVFRLRCALFDHVQRLSLVFHDRTPVGDSLYRVAFDTYSLQTLFNNAFIQTLTSLVTVIGIMAIMVSRDWRLSVVAMGFGLPMIWVLRRVEEPMRRGAQAVSEQESAVASRLQEMLSSIRVVQAFSGEARESWRFRANAEGSARASLGLAMVQAGSGLGAGLVLACGIASVVWLATYRVLTGSITPGDVVLFAAYVTMLYKPLESFAFVANTMQRAAAGLTRVFDVLDTQPVIRNMPGALPFSSRVQGRVRFEHVTFGYTPDHPVLDDLSFEAPPGSRIALVGPSGVGKTTVASLMLRFYDPIAGRIWIDDVDSRSVDVQSLRDSVALVLQDPVLFGATVRENIAYGRPGATLEEITDAAASAGARDFIAALPHGYDTEIGERGVLLSGGQRQRIAIARAFLKNAPILVLDEPTSALDSDTEAHLLVSLRDLMRGRTTITIAHRLSTIRDSDLILVLTNGRIVESGTHEQLIAGSGVYASLYLRQAGGAAGRAP
jgi:ABC-type multidrug transport system fused ATPase/permease subunit